MGGTRCKAACSRPPPALVLESLAFTQEAQQRRRQAAVPLLPAPEVEAAGGCAAPRCAKANAQRVGDIHCTGNGLF